MVSETTLSIVIPSYRREKVLTDTIGSLIPLIEHAEACLELIIVDQTEKHNIETDHKLRQWDRAGQIRLICPDIPHITRSMNIGVQQAKGDIVLFLDDDIMPAPKLIIEHINAYKMQPDVWAVVGQVLQPWDEPKSVSYTPKGGHLRRYLDFPFYSLKETFVENVMAGNLSVRKDRFFQLGGFDENFTPPVASRFETEFAKRLISHGGKILFVPKASIKHLRVSIGGTRSKGNHLTSISPIHGLGDYYYAFRCSKGIERFTYIFIKPFREVRTKFHLKHPWYIPVKLIGELRALIGALIISFKPPKYMAIKHDSK